MFDFANQSYTLLIITVIFPVFFTTVIVGDADQDFRLGNLLWSVALAVSYFMVVLSGPVLGAIMDYSALKKRFLFFSYILTIIATSQIGRASCREILKISDGVLVIHRWNVQS